MAPDEHAAALSRSALPLELVAVEVARDFVGTREFPSNRGAAVEYFQRAANIPPGSPWCAAFVNAVAEHAAAIKNVRSPLERIPLQGYVQSYVDHSNAHDWTVPGHKAMPGDLFAVWHASLGRYAHMGLISAVARGQARFWTIEGNTAEDGGREGVVVAERVRSLIDPGYVFIRWVPPVPVGV